MWMFYDWPDCFYSEGLGANGSVPGKTQYEIGYYRFELSDFSLFYLQVMGT